MTKDLIRYDLMVQEALKGVVRRILTEAARDGLPGEHHFYISFRTTAPGVRLSQRMRDKYPDEMTIVLQHQFWDLNVGDQAFEVGLSFGGVGERLMVPFEAITGFFDPSVQFGLKFEPKDGETAEGEAAAAAPRPAPLASVPEGPRPAPVEAAREPEKKPATKAPTKASKAAKPEEPAKVVEKAPDAPAETGAQIVSLDAFRKKT